MQLLKGPEDLMRVLHIDSDSVVRNRETALKFLNLDTRDRIGFSIFEGVFDQCDERRIEQF